MASPRDVTPHDDEIAVLDAHGVGGLYLEYGLPFDDLFRRERLEKIDVAFVAHLCGDDVGPHDRLVTARRDPAALGHKARVDHDKGLLSMILLASGGSSSLCAVRTSGSGRTGSRKN